MPVFELSQTAHITEAANTAQPLDNPEGIVVHQVNGRTFLFQTSDREGGVGRYEMNLDGSVTVLGTQTISISPDTSLRALEIVTIGDATFLIAANNGVEVFAVADDGTLTSVGTYANGVLFPNGTEGFDTVVIGGTTFIAFANIDDGFSLHPMSSDGTINAASDTLTAGDIPGGTFGFHLNSSFVQIGDKTFWYGEDSFDDQIFFAEVSAAGTFVNPALAGVGFNGLSRGLEPVQVGDSFFLLVTDFDGLRVFEIGADGGLTLTDTRNDLFGGTSDDVQAIAPFTTARGEVVVLANGASNDEAVLLEINADGTLTEIDRIGGADLAGGNDIRGAASFAIGNDVFFAHASQNDDSISVVKAELIAGDLTIDIDASSLVDTFIGAGEQVQLDLSTINIGTATADLANIRFYLSDDAVFDASDVLVDENITLELVPGAVDQFVFQFDIPAELTPPTDSQPFLIAVVDVDGTVIELNEGNNTAAFQFTASLFSDDDDVIDLNAPPTDAAAPTEMKLYRGDDTVTGTDAGEIIDAMNGNDTIFGGGGEDFLFGGDNRDRLFGGNDDDSISTGRGNDFANGGAGGDFMEGGEGKDRLLGGADDDVIYGDAGNDKLSGGKGQDILVGGLGKDRLTGGADGDLFVFTSVDQSPRGGINFDAITDFGRGDDSIVLSDIDANDVKFGNQNLRFIGNDQYFADGTTGEIRWIEKNGDVIVKVDADANGTTDMEILLKGITFISVDDFIL